MFAEMVLENQHAGGASHSCCKWQNPTTELNLAKSYGQWVDMEVSLC